MRRFACTILASLCIAVTTVPHPTLATQDRQPIGQVLEQIIEEEGVAAAVATYRELKSTDPQGYDFGEPQLSALGNKLLRDGKVKEARVLFQLRSEEYPQSAEAWGELAEACMHDGDFTASREFYEKDLKLDPGSIKALLKLNKLDLIANYDKREYMVPMRDGVKLFTQVYSPLDTSSEHPIMLKRTIYGTWPYGEEKINYADYIGPGLEFGAKKYIFVYQDVRGSGKSEGVDVSLTPYIPGKSGGQIDQTTDTHDIIDWLLGNVANHNGKVGLWGTSYPGFLAVMGLIDAHPAVAAVCPQAPVTDVFRGDDWHHNGAFFLLQGFLYNIDYRIPTNDLYNFFLSTGTLADITAEYAGEPPSSWHVLMEHGSYDEFWRERNTEPHLRDVEPAVLVTGGWFDAEDLYGSLATYRAIEQHNPGADNFLVMGPWYHGGWNRWDGDVLWDAEVMSDAAASHYRAEVVLPFFEHYLRGEGEAGLPEALVFETGANDWRRFDSWPPPQSEETCFYLGADGTFSDRAPSEESFDEFLSDPAKPVPHTMRMGAYFFYSYMLEDQRFAASRPDVLVYRTEPLSEDVTLAGPMQAELFVSTTGTDADWIVKVIDVYPDDAPDPEPNPRRVRMSGYQQLVRWEVMRGKFRNSLSEPEPFEPGEVTRVAFQLNDLLHRFRKGHRIMVQIQSSYFPLIDRNPQTFVDIYSAKKEDFRKATHRVHRSAQHPSRLVVRQLK